MAVATHDEGVPRNGRRLPEMRDAEGNTRLRVLLVTDLFRPVIGGLELQVEMTARELERRGHEVMVATLAEAVSPADDADLRVARVTSWTHRIPGAVAEARMAFHPPAPEPGAWLDLRRIIREFRPDVVHAHNWMAASVLGSLPETTALVLTMHDYGAACAKRTMVYDGVEDCSGPAFRKCARCASEHYGRARGLPIVIGHRLAIPRLFRRADAIVAVSSAVRDRVAGWIPTDRTSVLPAFLAGEPPAFADRPDFVPAVGPYVLAVGALVPVKGMNVLLDAYRLPSPPPAPLVLIGAARGGPAPELPENTRLVEDVPNPEVLRALRHAAVAVVPSLWAEPCPMTVLEALGCGTPIVASRVGGIPGQLEDGAVGMLVEPGDHVGLAAAVTAVLSDPQRATDMREAARRRAERYYAATVIKEIEAVYRRAVSRRSVVVGGR